MALIASDNGGGGSFKPVPAGVHVARCYRVIDLGTQKVSFQGEDKLQRKVMIGWEIHGEDDDGNPLLDDDGNPLTIAKRYTLSLSDKAKLRADLQAWRGREFTREELMGFDVFTVLDKWCMLNVTRTEGEGGKSYSNVSSITPLPKQMRASLPPAKYAPQQFDVSEPDTQLFETFSEKLQQTISGCVEWSKKKETTAQASKSAGNAATNSSTSFDDMDSDIPF